MAKILLQNITKYYGKDLILDNVSLDIKDKEFMCITGPSGSGKTTLLRLIAGLDTDYQGKIYIDDVDCTNLSPSERNVSMVFQEYALYPNLRAKDNISFPLRIKKYSKQRIAEKLKDTVSQIDIEIEKYLDFLPKELSSGHRQRVATGRAIIRDHPSVFLMDEPLSNLDAKMRMNTRTYLSKLITELKSTTIYVTSDSSEAMALGDRIAVLNNGKFMQVDRPYDIYYHPKNMLIADFFGVLGMNFISGRVEDGKFYFDGHTIEFSRYLQGDVLSNLARDKKLILGIRPEDIYFSTSHKENKIKAEVELIQRFPPKANIRCRFKGSTINVITFAKNITDIVPGIDIYLDFDKCKIYLFNPESGNAVYS